MIFQDKQRLKCYNLMKEYQYEKVRIANKVAKAL